MKTPKYPITIIKQDNSYLCLYKHIEDISKNVKKLIIPEETFLQIKKSSLKKVLKILEDLYNQ